MDVSKYMGNVFLKVDDVKASGPIRVRITDVSEGRFGKLDLTFHDGTQLSLNTTNCRKLGGAYGIDGDHWLGKEVELSIGEIEYNSKMQETIQVKPISPPIENKAPRKPDSDDEIRF